MYRKQYTIALVLSVGMLLLGSDIMAQRVRAYRGPVRGYYPRYAPVRSFVSNRPFVSIQFGGMRYRYQQGYFYRPYGTSFSVVLPPVGIRIQTLPPGYRRIRIGSQPYYYHGGIYYRSLNDREYEVVAPPLGAELSQLPAGAKVTVINGAKYYEVDGTYYKEMIDAGNKLYYKVVGVDSVLNTEETDYLDIDDEMMEELEANDSTVVVGPKVGDQFEELPKDSKVVVINGAKLYVSGSGLYYKEVIVGDKVLYEVVGQ